MNKEVKVYKSVISAVYFMKCNSFVAEILHSLSQIGALDDETEDDEYCNTIRRLWEKMCALVSSRCNISIFTKAMTAILGCNTQHY